MLSMETKTQQAPGNAEVIPNQNNPGQASLDNTAQTGHTAVGDWQEEIYQMIKSLKDQYFAELSELFNKLSVKLQHVDSIIPPPQPSEQNERMKSFKIMLERILQILEISKSNIQPALRDKVPQYEKQIISILNSQRREPVQAQVQQQFLQVQMNPYKDSAAQTGHAGAGDWQEEIYQIIKSLKDQYFAELSELFSKHSLKLQCVQSTMPPQKPSEQYKRMKNFKMMLERVLQILHIEVPGSSRGLLTLHFVRVRLATNTFPRPRTVRELLALGTSFSKSAIQPALRGKVPQYEKQIINILSSQRRKPVRPRAPQRFQPPAGQAPNSNISRQRQPSHSFQQHDGHTNPQASFLNVSTGLQPSSAAGFQYVPAPPTTNFGVPTQQRNGANIQQQAGSNMEAAQGSYFSPLQYGSMGGAVQQGSTWPMEGTMNAQLQTSMLSHSSMSTAQPNANSMQANANGWTHFSGHRKHMPKQSWHDTL